MTIDRQKYLQEIENNFFRLFSNAREGYQEPDQERYRLQGFIRAGVFLGLISNDEIRNLMDRVHVAVFGQTIQQRRDDRSGVWLDESIDYGVYDRPAFERVRSG